MKKLFKISNLALAVLASLSAASDVNEESIRRSASQTTLGMEGISIYSCPGHANPSISQRNRYDTGNLMWCPRPLGCRGYIIKKQLADAMTPARTDDIADPGKSKD